MNVSCRYCAGDNSSEKSPVSTRPARSANSDVNIGLPGTGLRNLLSHDWDARDLHPSSKAARVITVVKLIRDGGADSRGCSKVVAIRWVAFRAGLHLNSPPGLIHLGVFRCTPVPQSTNMAKFAWSSMVRLHSPFYFPAKDTCPNQVRIRRRWRSD